MKTPKHLATVMAITMVAGSVAPVMAATTSSETIIGNDRHETAVKISKDGWSSAETVILVNSSAIPDALTATPLAHAKKAPILLTGKDGLNKATANEIKRLGAKNVIMIGGDAVLSAKVEKDLKALNLKVDRIKGETREETALAIAKRLDGIKDVSEIAVVNGTTGLADAVSVAAAAAEKGMPILLANPKKGLSAAEKFIKDEAIKASFIIGGTTALPEKLVSSLPGKQRIEGSNRNDTNAKVIEKFYGDKELDNLYLAKDGRDGDTQLIDALAVGALAAKNGAPVLIASKKLSEKQIDVINTKKIDTITQVGGKGNEGAFNQLKDIEETDVYEVGTVEELKEALEKANANDKIVLKPNATITEDIIINTDKNVDIKVEGTVTGKVEITAPNGNVTDNSTSKPSTGGGTIVTPPADNSIKVDTPEELKEALKNAKAGDVIKITGNIGSTSSYGVYNVKANNVTITSNSKNTVYGSFVVTGEKCVINNITITNQGDKQGENTVDRNGINVACSDLTVTNCTFNNNSQGGITNGLSIWPTSTTVNYKISGNTFNGFKANDSGYSSVAITIAGGVAKENITGIKEASKLANMTDAQDKAIIDGNIFVDCKGDYCREDWTNGNKVYCKSISNGDNLYLEGAADSAKYYVTNNIERKSNATVKEGTTLAIASGKTISLVDGAELTVNGEVTGTIIGKGSTSKLVIGENGKYGNLEKGTYLWTNNEWVNEKTAIVSTAKELRNALANEEKTTIKLNESIEIEGKIDIPRSMTLDLNDCTLTQSANDDGIVITTDGVVLNIKNGTVSVPDNTAKGNHVAVFVSGVKQPDGSMKITKNVTVNMSGVKIEMGGFSNPTVGECDYANLFGVYANGTCEDISFDIDGCNISGAAVGIYFPAGSKNINIRNSNITGGTAVGIKGGNGEIYNSTLTGTGLSSDAYIDTIKPSSSGIAEAGEALLIEGNYPDRGINVVVKESNLLSKNGYGIRMQFFQGKSAKELTFESGTVSGKLGSVFKNFRDLEVQNPDGSKTVYKKDEEIKRFNQSFIKEGGTFTPEFSKPEETNPTV